MRLSDAAGGASLMLSYAGVQNQVRLTAQATGRDLAGRPLAASRPV